MTNIWAAPELSLRWTPIWRRNLLVWRKLAIASVLGNIADPMLYMLAIGYGIGAFIPEMNGMKYIAFIGTGMVCQSAMFTASFEGMYSAFSRMYMQRTWDAIINTPMSLDDVLFAEWIWCATKSVFSVTAILLTTHFMDEAERLATRLAVIDPGKLIASDAPRALIAEHVEPEVIEVYGDEARQWGESVGRSIADRIEITGETAFCYARDPQPLLHALQGNSGVRYLHRPANLEDLFIKLTGRELRD